MIYLSLSSAWTCPLPCKVFYIIMCDVCGFVERQEHVIGSGGDKVLPPEIPEGWTFIQGEIRQLVCHSHPMQPVR